MGEVSKCKVRRKVSVIRRKKLEEHLATNEVNWRQVSSTIGHKKNKNIYFFKKEHQKGFFKGSGATYTPIKTMSFSEKARHI